MGVQSQKPTGSPRSRKHGSLQVPSRAMEPEAIRRDAFPLARSRLGAASTAYHPSCVQANPSRQGPSSRIQGQARLRDLPHEGAPWRPQASSPQGSGLRQASQRRYQPPQVPSLPPVQGRRACPTPMLQPSCASRSSALTQATRPSPAILASTGSVPQPTSIVRCVVSPPLVSPTGVWPRDTVTTSVAHPCVPPGSASSSCPSVVTVKQRYNRWFQNMFSTSYKDSLASKKKK